MFVMIDILMEGNRLILLSRMIPNILHIAKNSFPDMSEERLIGDNVYKHCVKDIFEVSAYPSY